MLRVLFEHRYLSPEWSVSSACRGRLRSRCYWRKRLSGFGDGGAVKGRHPPRSLRKLDRARTGAPEFERGAIRSAKGLERFDRKFFRFLFSTAYGKSRIETSDLTGQISPNGVLRHEF
jgi:hypothetical protein